MGQESFIRVWKKLDLDQISKHLLIAGDPRGDCANCKEVGLNIAQVQVCPNCKTEFKYIASRLSQSHSQAKKILAKRHDLTIVDLEDYKGAIARSQARKFMM